MKRILLALLMDSVFVLLLSTSCTAPIPNKEYIYTEIVKTGWTIEAKEPKVITAKTDSLAYLEAYQTFCISQAAYIKMYSTVDATMRKYLDEPASFVLCREDETGNIIEICKSDFDGMPTVLDSIYRKVMDIVFRPEK